jgi:DNA-binding HxlR family transcriptional regulator
LYAATSINKVQQCENEGNPVATTGRSDCPINLTAELLGDRWSLIVLRDIIFADRRHFRVLLQNSEEKIASNTLAARLRNLVEEGLLSTSDDATHKQKIVYSLTEAGIELLPMMISIGTWGNKNRPASPITGPYFAYVYEQGPQIWTELADDLRHRHLGGPAPKSSAATIDSTKAAYGKQLRATTVR